MSIFSLGVVAATFGLLVTLTSASRAADQYEGQVDGCTLQGVSGWVLRNKASTSITVMVNGKMVGAGIPATVPRADVAKVTGGVDASGFDFKVPLKAGDKVRVTFANGELVHGPQGQFCTAK